MALLFRPCFARGSFCSQTFAVFVEGLLRRLMFPHRLLGVGPAFGVARFSRFRGENSGRASRKLIGHAQITRKFPKSCATGTGKPP
jgi:hypothetical protein